MRRTRVTQLAGLLALAILAGVPASAQPQGHGPSEPDIHNIIIPQVRRHVRHAQAVRLDAVSAKVDLTAQVATTALTMTVTNPHSNPQEAQLLIPVPDGVTVRSVQYDGTGPEPSAAILPRDEARRIYDAIVNKARDPALVEFAGYNLIRTSLFPVPANTTQTVTITFEQLLPADGDRIDYVLPRSESLAEQAVRWDVRVSIDDPRGIAAVYSPSHDLTVDRQSDRRAVATTPAASALPPGAFRLSYLRGASESGSLSATLMAYPDPSVAGGQGGYFLLLAKLPRPTDMRQDRAREVILVLDRSGSMRGEKFDQARKAAIQVIDGLFDGETFNIIDYSDTIGSFAKAPVEKSRQSAADARAYIQSLEPNGGTNIHDALLEAVRQRPADNCLPVVLFLTDGLPTVGERGEIAIRDAVARANSHDRRIFSFGVGYDVNAPLLNSIAISSRGAATMVLPNEDVEQKVSQVYQRLRGPQLMNPALHAVDSKGEISTRLVREVLPGSLNDIYEQDEVLILGQYTTDQPLRFRLTGHRFGKDHTYEFSFGTGDATTRNSFVPRIWATRKIAQLTEQLRQAAATGSSAGESQSKELVDEIVRLSSRWGIMTEYTSFLATDESMPLARFRELRDGQMVELPGDVPPAPAAEAGQTLYLRQKERTGADAVAQQQNYSARSDASNVALGLEFLDESMNRTRITTVQNAADRSLFRRGQRWVDSMLGGLESTEPEVTIEFGSEAYFGVVRQLASEGRQGMLAVDGDVYTLLNGKRTLIRGPRADGAK
ncbi:MAG: hypothetical protein AMXMBFR58_21420 [Phycisphaerae bacterium]